MKKIVITGGPCAGKSTLISKLKNIYKYIYFVPEVATLLFEEGFPSPNPWSYDWQKNFQIAVAFRQIQEENKAQRSNAQFIICDRGLFDGASYLEGGIKEFCNLFRINQSTEMHNYSKIVHLESLSTLDPDKYQTLMKTNPHRFEDIEVAQKREFACREAWKSHPNRIYLKAYSIQDCVNIFISKVDEIPIPMPDGSRKVKALIPGILIEDGCHDSAGDDRIHGTAAIYHDGLIQIIEAGLYYDFKKSKLFKTAKKLGVPIIKKGGLPEEKIKSAIKRIYDDFSGNEPSVFMHRNKESENYWELLL